LPVPKRTALLASPPGTTYKLTRPWAWTVVNFRLSAVNPIARYGFKSSVTRRALPSGYPTYQTCDSRGLSPPTMSNPLISLSHCVLAANCQRYEDNSRSLPSSTEKLISLDQPPTVATVAATNFPSGDQDGPAKNSGENFSGSFLTARSRCSLPSMLAITSELSP